MDNSNLFSHPDAPEYVAPGEASRKPVEYPTFSDRPDDQRCRICNATIVNGSAGARRCARPVRITLARVLGRDIDGAWWPHSGSVAA